MTFDWITAERTTALAAVVAAVAATVTGYRTAQLTRRNIEALGEQAAAAKRASIRCERIGSRSVASSHVVVRVSNDGPAPAVAVRMDEERPGEHRFNPRAVLPTRLEPRRAVDLSYVHVPHANYGTVTVLWTDGDGERAAETPQPVTWTT